MAELFLFLSNRLQFCDFSVSFLRSVSLAFSLSTLLFCFYLYFCCFGLSFTPFSFFAAFSLSLPLPLPAPHSFSPCQSLFPRSDLPFYATLSFFFFLVLYPFLLLFSPSSCPALFLLLSIPLPLISAFLYYTALLSFCYILSCSCLLPVHEYH